MKRLLCGSLALLLASVAFAGPRHPATPGTSTMAKHRGKGHRGKKSKAGKTGTAQPGDGQTAPK